MSAALRGRSEFKDNHFVLLTPLKNSMMPNISEVSPEKTALMQICLDEIHFHLPVKLNLQAGGP